MIDGLIFDGNAGRALANLENAGVAQTRIAAGNRKMFTAKAQRSQRSAEGRGQSLELKEQ